MQRHVQVLILLLALAVAATATAAANYQVGVTPLNISTLQNESATFRLTITNFERTALRFQAYTLDTRWIVHTDPVLSLVEAQNAQDYVLFIKPTSVIGYGAQGLVVLVKNLDENVINKESVIVYVIDPNRPPGIYGASVNLDVKLPEEVNPRKQLTIGLSLRNRNGLNISKLDIDISSPLFSQAMSQPLEPFGERTEDFTFTLDPYQAAGEYPLTVKLSYEGRVINEVTKSVPIEAITDISETPTDKEELFRHTTTLSLENRGNVRTTYEARLSTSWLRNIFSSTSPPTGTKKIAGVRYHVWEVPLAPGEKATLTRTENYRLLAVILIVTIVGVVAYFLMRSPLIAVKEAIALKEAGEEGSSHTKVRIFVKNRTGRPLSGVSIIDRVPPLATYRPTGSLGSVTPTKVVASPKGTMLKWELDILEPYEERILSYGLGSQLKVIGRMSLPAAKVKFTTKNGERVTYTRNTAYEE
jgi:hypothetical protein